MSAKIFHFFSQRPRTYWKNSSFASIADSSESRKTSSFIRKQQNFRKWIRRKLAVEALFFRLDMSLSIKAKIFFFVKSNDVMLLSFLTNVSCKIIGLGTAFITLLYKAEKIPYRN